MATSIVVRRSQWSGGPIRTGVVLVLMGLGAVGCGGAAEGGAEVSANETMAAAAYDATVVTAHDDAAMRALIAPDAALARVATDLMFIEGPVWRAEEGGFLLFSDVPANEMKRWDATGGVRTFRAPSGPSNGNTLDLEGRLVTAQHDGRVTRTEADGSVVTLAQTYEGDQLNSPNDVVVKSDGTIWFTDPVFGIGDREPEVPGRYVYRLDPESGALTAVIEDMTGPNGLCFSPDESRLYVADASNRHIRAFDIAADATATGGEIFAEVDAGTADGIRCDELGNVWSSAGDGIQIFSPSGDRIGRILVPESPANLGFGGPDGRTVFITARTSLYSIPVLVGDAAAR